MLVNLLAKCSGHSGIAGGQFLDLTFENMKVSSRKIVEMQIKKTGELFSFCCVAPVIMSKKYNYIKKFEKLGLDIGLLFQIADDLIDYTGNSKKAGKKTKKDLKKGKANLINLLGYKNTIKYSEKLKLDIFKKLNVFEEKAKELKNTISYILERDK